MILTQSTTTPTFVRQMVERRNRLVEGKLEQEMACLRSLPPAPVPGIRQLPVQGAPVVHHPGSGT